MTTLEILVKELNAYERTLCECEENPTTTNLNYWNGAAFGYYAAVIAFIKAEQLPFTLEWNEIISKWMLVEITKEGV